MESPRSSAWRASRSLRGWDWIKVYGSTGSDQDVTGFQTFTYEEMKAAVDVAHRAGKAGGRSIRTGPTAPETL